MTDKERLEEIKSRVWKEKCTYAIGDYRQREGYIYTLSDYDYEWLIEQAERVEELEEERDEWKDTAQSYYMTNQELRERNKRYKQALEFYADSKNWIPQNDDVLSEITMDYGSKAQQALGWEETQITSISTK